MSILNKGKIKIIVGCMKAAKTTMLINEYNSWKSINQTPLCINYAEDTRYGNDNKLYTHSGQFIECLKVKSLEEVPQEEIDKTSVIIINEGQFFTDLVKYCLIWCDIHDKHIIVCGLDGDSKRQVFGQILYLIPHCDEVIKLVAKCNICNDGTPALFSHRISKEKEQKVIGVDNYISICRKCYNDANPKFIEDIQNQ